MSSNQTAPSDSSLQGQYAGFVTRLGALLVDILLVIAILLTVGLIGGLLLFFFGLTDLFVSLINMLSERSSVFSTVWRVLLMFGSFYFVFFIYYVTIHTAGAGVTIGKALLGLRVVRMDGYPLTLGRATRRYIMFLLSALPLFAGLLWVIIDDRRQGWHDKLSNTCVIYDWPAREDETMLAGMRHRLRYVQETRRRYGIGSGGEGEGQHTAETVTPPGLT